MFPTRPRGPLNGRPRQAEHCTCHGSAFHKGRCLNCGKLPELTVRGTFARQARRAARNQRQIRRAA